MQNKARKISLYSLNWFQKWNFYGFVKQLTPLKKSECPKKMPFLSVKQRGLKVKVIKTNAKIEHNFFLHCLCRPK
jgi:hypothetical protein